MHYLRISSFSLMGILVGVLIGGTIVEQCCGHEAAVRYCYAAPWTIALWLAAVAAGGVCIADYLRRPVALSLHRVAVAGIHFSFAVILAGAMCTHLFGEEGSIPLRIGESTEATAARPWRMTLTDFRVLYYAATATPEDYVSTVRMEDAQGGVTEGEIAMNRVFRYRGWRFYQSSYDADRGGCTLRYTHDPAGIGITYAGYALLLLSMIGYLCSRERRDNGARSKEQGIKNKDKLVQRRRYLVLCLLSLFLCPPLMAAAAPVPVQAPVAESFGRLYVEYNGRVCPMSTVAADVCRKLYGKPYYKAEDGTQYTANQVLTGLLFDYEAWCDVPLKHSRKARQNAERETIRRMAGNGALCRIWQDADGWYDINDAGSNEVLSNDERLFQMYALQYVASDLAHGNNIGANETLKKIREYQKQHFRDLPGERRFAAEQVWVMFGYTLPLAFVCLAVSLLLLMMNYELGKRNYAFVLRWVTTAVCVLLWAFLTAMLVWRWYISGHVPMSNGHETMQFLAWVCLLIASTLCITSRRPRLLQGRGYGNGVLETCNLKHETPYTSAGCLLLVAGMALLVSNMSASNPQISHLMPVLQSPLLSLHVSVIMVSYALFALLMLQSVIAMLSATKHLTSNSVSGQTANSASGPTSVHMRLLRIGVCCLTAGIFLGAVWANMSWGRYWGWDPKEVWALITLLVYAFPLHSRMLPFFRRPRVFYLYCVLAFGAVLFTYFGVNFLLGGMHAYQ